MPQTIADRDGGAYFWSGWGPWPVPIMDDISPEQEPWAGVPGSFWRDRVDGRPVDRARTARLAAVDVPITCGAGAPPWEGSTYGAPHQLIDSTAKTTPVYDQSRQPVESHPWWKLWLGPRYVVYPITQVPLPETVLREGDPNGSSDLHWRGYDPDEKVLWEGITLRRPRVWNPLTNEWMYGWQSEFQTEWVAGYSGGGPAFSRWDTSKPWDAKGQPSGVVAAGTPALPFVVRFDEVKRAIESGDPDRGVGHAVHGVLPNYDRGIVRPARHGDGTLTGHPVRSGERLRLPWEIARQFPEFTIGRVFANTLATNGWCHGDRSQGDPKDGVFPAGKGVGGFPLSQDRRFHEGDGKIRPLGKFEIRLAQMEVVAQ